MFRHEGRAKPGHLRIVSTLGDLIEPFLSEGEGLVIDNSRRHPTTGGFCVLRDGNGLAIRRVEIVHGTNPAQLRLTTENPNYAPITCLAKEARIVATVLWMFRRP